MWIWLPHYCSYKFAFERIHLQVFHCIKLGNNSVMHKGIQMLEFLIYAQLKQYYTHLDLKSSSGNFGLCVNQQFTCLDYLTYPGHKCIVPWRTQIHVTWVQGNQVQRIQMDPLMGQVKVMTIILNQNESDLFGLHSVSDNKKNNKLSILLGPLWIHGGQFPSNQYWPVIGHCNKQRTLN